MKPVFVTISPHLSQILYFIINTHLSSKMLEIEREKKNIQTVAIYNGLWFNITVLAL